MIDETVIISDREYWYWASRLSDNAIIYARNREEKGLVIVAVFRVKNFNLTLA